MCWFSKGSKPRTITVNCQSLSMFAGSDNRRLSQLQGDRGERLRDDRE